MAEPLLQLENLSRRFGKTLAVDDVSFSIEKGEIFGLVGESGSGKTTLGRCIMGLWEPTDGRVLFHGRQIRPGGKGRQRMVRQIQMIFQDPMASLDPRMTVGDSIAEGWRIAGMRDAALLREKVDRMLQLVGLRPEHAGRYPHEFSGGQRQRIGIARAIIMEPELLIADEPVSALDVSVQAQVINLLSDLRQEMGLTVLFIAHDLAVVKYFCTRIAVMRFGKLVELAQSEELFARPLHPYTKSLLSAIPLPDPEAERKRRRIEFIEPPEEARQLREIYPGHWVLCSHREERELKV